MDKKIRRKREREVGGSTRKMVVVLVVLPFFFTFSNFLPLIKSDDPTSFVLFLVSLSSSSLRATAERKQQQRNPHRPSQRRLVVRMERQVAAAALATEGRKGKEREKKQEVAMEEEEEGEEEDEEEEEKRKRATTTVVLGRKGSNSGQAPCCQAENCSADLTNAKRYHRRHKVCETHSKAAIVMVAGLRQRFCQQCSRFHEISEFDEAKRSCRRRLAGHNERRRKNSVDSQADGTTGRGIGHQLKDNHCRSSEEAGRMQITLQGNRTCKHFQIR